VSGNFGITALSASHSFAHLLRLYRVAAGLSQERLAEAARLSAKAIGALERGERRAPYQKTVSSLADAMHLEGSERSEFEMTAARARIRRTVASTDVEARHNLPAHVTSFVGRERDRMDLSQLLSRHRIVTLTGPGGIGKTRLAIATVERELVRYPDGVWFVDLASISHPAAVAAKIASTLGLVLDDRDPNASLASALRLRKALLLVDNCEHLVNGVAALVATILKTCPYIAVLATSRQRLALAGEAIFRLASLDVPPEAAALTETSALNYSSIRLLVERAELADRHFVLDAHSAPLVAAMCRKLEGNALAIEICAAQMRTLGPELALRALDDRLAFRARGVSDVPERQRTLFATIDWSYGLLDESERVVLRRVSIFAASCSAKAARAVCIGGTVAADAVEHVLAALIEKSLLNVEFTKDGPRYTLLDAARDYGRRKLREYHESAEIAVRYATWAASFADDMLRSSLYVSRDEWHARVAIDFDNAYAALLGTLDSNGDARLAARILGGLRSYLNVLGRRAESYRLAERILHRLDPDLDPGVAARILLTKSFYLFGVDRLRLVERATALYTQTRDPRELATCYKQLAHSYSELGRIDEAARALGWAATFMAVSGVEHTRILLLVCELRADLLQRQGRLTEAREHYARGGELARRHGDVVIEQSCSASLGELEFFSGNTLDALDTFRRLVLADHEAFRMHVYEHMAACYIRLGRLGAAAESARIPLLSSDALPLTRLIAIERLAHVAALKGDVRWAARVRGFVNDAFVRSEFLRDAFDERCCEAFGLDLAARLDAASTERYEREGAALSLERVVAEALTVSVS
jgi:predicted ATPase/DNA-binding XRE family transcriptional regulator